jgi:diguanylate cyclase (GGDEF)-like protein
MMEKTRKLQAHRLRVTAATIANALLQSLIVVLYAATGTVSWPIAGAFFAVSLLTTGAYTLAVWRGWNLRWPDSMLLYAQLATNYAIQLVFIVVAPALWMVFLASTLVTVNYATMNLSARQFLWGWIGFGITTALALWWGASRFSTPAPTPANIAILWLFFFLAVRRLAVIGNQFSRLREQLSERNDALQASLERIEQLASHDELTGAFNRREFLKLLNEERERSRRTLHPYSVALFDLDHFKAVNDRFGHAAGDQVLRVFCELAQKAKRTTDRFARYGGEEFVLLMPATTAPESAAVAVERIRAALSAHDWQGLLDGGRVTVSAGIATARDGEAVEDLMARADAALYEAKRQGRDRSVAA